MNMTGFQQGKGMGRGMTSQMAMALAVLLIALVAGFCFTYVVDRITGGIVMRSGTFFPVGAANSSLFLAWWRHMGWFSAMKSGGFAVHRWEKALNWGMFFLLWGLLTVNLSKVYADYGYLLQDFFYEAWRFAEMLLWA